MKKRYRYYVSQQVLQSHRQNAAAQSVPAELLERTVGCLLCKALLVAVPRFKHPEAPRIVSCAYHLLDMLHPSNGKVS